MEIIEGCDAGREAPMREGWDAGLIVWNDLEILSIVVRQEKNENNMVEIYVILGLTQRKEIWAECGEGVREMGFWWSWKGRGGVGEMVELAEKVTVFSAEKITVLKGYFF